MASDDGLLVDRIYEAGLVPSLWPEILGEMASRFDGVGTVLLASGPGGDQIYWGRTAVRSPPTPCSRP